VSHRRHPRQSALGLAERHNACSTSKADPPHTALTVYATKMSRWLVLAHSRGPPYTAVGAVAGLVINFMLSKRFILRNV
jgi:hypothetical protein